jgi:hypothetical protein
MADADAMPTALLLTFLAVIGIGVAATVLLSRPRPSGNPEATPDVGVGTVQTIEEVVTVEVESVTGQRFTGRLCDDSVVSALRPGAVLLVAFDPAAREHLSLADDMLAVRATFDQMLVSKGLLTGHQLELIRHGTRSEGVVTGMRATGGAREDHREVVLDVMVRRPAGGQFPAHETALVPASSMSRVSPGSVVYTYYRPQDESSVAIAVPPS